MELRDFSSFFLAFMALDLSKVSLQNCVRFVANHFFQRSADASASSTSAAHTGAATSSSSPPLLVLFMVDELTKSQREDDILRLIGDILDTEQTLHDGRRFTVLPVFTSLSQVRMTSLCSKSNRGFLVVPLPVPLPGASEALKSLLDLKPQQGVLIDALYRDVGGHGRMLEAIARTLALGSDIRSRLDASYLSPLTFLREIHSHLMSTETLSSSFFKNLAGSEFLVDAVCASLLGRLVSRRELVAPVEVNVSQWTYDDLQELGVFIGDAADAEGQIIPVMSPLQLTKWASSVSSGRPACHADDQFGVFLRSIVNMFSAESLYDWATFERFHLRTLTRT